jgi:conjugative transposon TraJ protein
MRAKIFLIISFLFSGLAFAQSGNGAADGMAEWANSLRGLQPMIAEIGQSLQSRYWGVLGAVTTILAIGLIFYIFTRVYRSLLAGEPIDWWGLLKPAKILVLIMCYPIIINLMTTVLSPIRGVTAGMNVSSNERMVAARRAALENSEDWKMFVGKGGDGDFQKYIKKYGSSDGYFGEEVDQISFSAQQTWVNIKYAFKAILSEILRLAYESAILVLHFIATFYMVILVILGPIPLALSLIPGFENGFSSWIAQYIDKFLWLPIANILSTLLNDMQLSMINASVAAESLGEGSFFSTTDFGYFIFLIIGIAAFLCVPSISGMIVSAGSPSSTLGKAATAAATGGASAIAAGVGGAVGASKGAAQGANQLRRKITG